MAESQAYSAAVQGCATPLNADPLGGRMRGIARVPLSILGVYFAVGGLWFAVRGFLEVQPATTPAAELFAGAAPVLAFWAMVGLAPGLVLILRARSVAEDLFPVRTSARTPLSVLALFAVICGIWLGVAGFSALVGWSYFYFFSSLVQENQARQQSTLVNSVVGAAQICLAVAVIYAGRLAARAGAQNGSPPAV